MTICLFKGEDFFGSELPGKDVLLLLPRDGEAVVNISRACRRFSGQQNIQPEENQ